MYSLVLILKHPEKWVNNDISFVFKERENELKAKRSTCEPSQSAKLSFVPCDLSPDAVSHAANENHWEQEHGSAGPRIPDPPAGVVRLWI